MKEKIKEAKEISVLTKKKIKEGGIHVVALVEEGKTIFLAMINIPSDMKINSVAKGCIIRYIVDVSKTKEEPQKTVYKWLFSDVMLKLKIKIVKFNQ